MTSTVGQKTSWQFTRQNPYVFSLIFLTERMTSLFFELQKIDNFVIIQDSDLLLDEGCAFEWIHHFIALLQYPVHKLFIFALVLAQFLLNNLIVLVLKAFIWFNKPWECFSKAWIATLVKLRGCLWFKLHKPVWICKEFMLSPSLLCLSEHWILVVHLLFILVHCDLLLRSDRNVYHRLLCHLKWQVLLLFQRRWVLLIFPTHLTIILSH